MNYPFKCSVCGRQQLYSSSISKGPPQNLKCLGPDTSKTVEVEPGKWHTPCCGGDMDRVWTAPMFICNSDPDFVKPDKRVFDTMDRRPEAVKEAAFQRHIDERRATVREAGHNPNSMRQTHSVPADLFHGKIRESGDKQYWDDLSNLKKHKSCKVD